MNEINDKQLEKVNGGVVGDEINDGILFGGLYLYDAGTYITVYRTFGNSFNDSFHVDLKNFDRESGKVLNYQTDRSVGLDILKKCRYLGTCGLMVFETANYLNDLKQN